MNKIFNRPDPSAAFPNPNLPRLCFIKNVVKNPRIIIGDYTYYDDVDGADQFEKHVTHFYDFALHNGRRLGQRHRSGEGGTARL